MRSVVKSFNQPATYVVATDDSGTRAALRTASALARGAGARLILLVAHVVPYQLSLDHPADPTQVIAARYRAMVEKTGMPAQVRVCLCHGVEEVLHQIRPGAMVVIGGTVGRWRLTRYERLSRTLARRGYHVVFAPVTAAGSRSHRRKASVVAATIVAALAIARPVAGQPAGGEAAAADDPDSQTVAPDGPLDGIVFAVGFDGYYAWNTNRPLGRVNLLRAYDVSSNSFSVNQANVIVERGIDAAKGRRAGLRLDLMFGQATETLQGSASNEPRPQVYRQLFQVYGSYLFPAGRGLQVDFGKFASALGFENNYTKDQINYSRSYFFNFLPFYHMGVRSTYAPSDKLSLTYWLVNGAQQTEDFNGFKSQAAIVTIKPLPSVSWNVNYYQGREARDLTPALNPGIPALPTQPGLSIDAISGDRSRLHILDSYASWTTARTLLAVEGDYVAVRPETGPSAVVKGGALYGQHRVTPQVQLGARYAYFSDEAGLFSGLSQNLKDTTVTIVYQAADGIQLRAEWRRDWSNEEFFLGRNADERRRAQQTITGGVVWWFGTKQGSW